MKFNDVFKANNHAGRKKILDRFPLSKEDKANVNKSIEELSQSNGDNKSNLVYYKNNRFDDKGLNSFYHLLCVVPVIKGIIGTELLNDDSLEQTYEGNVMGLFMHKYGDDRFTEAFCIDTSLSLPDIMDGLFINTSGTMQQRYQQIIDSINNDNALENDKEALIATINEEWNLWKSLFTEITKEEYESLITLK